MLTVFAAASVATAHILECYECASMRDMKDQPIEAIKRDPCWDPIANKINATKCPEGTSCYKQETILMDVRTGDGVLSERLAHQLQLGFRFET